MVVKLVKEKLQVDIYAPTSRCACDWQLFMDRVFEVLMPYLKRINFETIDSDSEGAKKMKLPIECVVIGGEVFTSMDLLKKRLAELII